MPLLFEKGDRILFIGDSIGDYDRGHPFGDAPDSWGESYISLIAGLLQSTYPELDLRVCNVCTSGDQTRNLLKRWESDVISWQPDWVCMMIGINDVWRRYDSPDHPEEAVPLAEYEQNLDKLLSETLPKVHDMVLMTPYCMIQSKNDTMRTDMDAYGAAVKRVGEKYGCLVVDMQQAWDEYFARSGRHPHSISWDCIHPNQVGRALLCRAFLKAVGFDW